MFGWTVPFGSASLWVVATLLVCLVVFSLTVCVLVKRAVKDHRPVRLAYRFPWVRVEFEVGSDENPNPKRDV
jgi:hypothetical protein